MDYIVSAKFGLIVFLFLMPFINVSCGGMVNIPLSGLDLAKGKTLNIKEPFSGKIKQQKINPEPFASVAMGCALIGLFVSFSRAWAARAFNVAAAGFGALFLLLLKNKIDTEVMQQGGGMIAVQYDIGFWGAVLLFILAAIFGIYLLNSSPQKDNSTPT